MLEELKGAEDAETQAETQAEGLFSHQQVHQRLTHIEGTISSIQAMLLETGELSTERHHTVVARLEDLQEGVAANKKLLRQLKRSCIPTTKGSVVCAALLIVALWLYIVYHIVLT